MNYIKINLKKMNLRFIFAINFKQVMKKILFGLFILSSVMLTTNAFSSTSDNIQLELFLMRKGSVVKMVITASNNQIPVLLEIERKTTASLSVYSKIKTLSKEDLLTLKKDGKIILVDEYTESRQLDSYYRLKFVDSKGVFKTPPAVFLAKASGEESITFGDHLKNAEMFETEEEKYIPTYEEFQVKFLVKRVDLSNLITIAGGSSLDGDWFIERKSSKPLASFRVVKTISKIDKELTIKGEHVFIDKYPESRKLDAYYRLVVIDKKGNRLELPSVLLLGTAAG